MWLKLKLTPKGHHSIFCKFLYAQPQVIAEWANSIVTYHPKHPK